MAVISELLRWLVLACIRLYRRRISGRGPLRRVRCTFHHCESCSAYGLRVAQQAPSVWVAVRLLRRRLRRCGSAALYRNERGWLWGELYDDVDDAEELVALLRSEQELPQTREAVLRAAVQVAAARGDRAACRRLERHLGPEPARLVVRRASVMQRTLQRRAVARVVLCLVPALALPWLPWWLAVPIAAVLAVIAVSWLRPLAQQRERFEHIEASQLFELSPVAATLGEGRSGQHRSSLRYPGRCGCP